ncbi:MAG: YdcF family protein [Planctomycetaceae bacterium]
MTISRRTAIALICVAGATGAVCAVGIVDGRAALEKVLLRLLAPVGLLWLALALQCGQAFFRRQRGWCIWSCALWLALTLVGNGTLVPRAYASLERPLLRLDPLHAPPYDVLIVLGGGARSGPTDRPQLNESGDRLLLAAQLYHAGQVRRVICTGQRIAALAPDGHSDPAEQTHQILKSLGVPESIMTMSGGTNTAEEMRQLAAGPPLTGRVGLLTSAWHLPRALRLARAHGLDLEPVPADFQGNFGAVAPANAAGLGATVLDVIPTAEVLAAAGRLGKEWLAGLVGR